MASLKALIVVKSIHHQNTLAVAQAMAEVMPAEICQPAEATNEKLSQYELIGFGSGVYFGMMHRELLKMAVSPSAPMKARFAVVEVLPDLLDAHMHQVVSSFICDIK